MLNIKQTKRNLSRKPKSEPERKIDIAFSWNSSTSKFILSTRKNEKKTKNSYLLLFPFSMFFFSFAWRSSCCRLVFYLFSMSFLLFISVLNNSPESSKRRDLYIFLFSTTVSTISFVRMCVHILEWNVCNNHQGTYIHSNKISLFSLMCLFSFYSNVEYFCVPFKVHGSYLFWIVEIYIFLSISSTKDSYDSILLLFFLS